MNAFTTEVPSRSASPSAAALKGLLMSTRTLPASASPYWGDDRHGAGVQHGEDDDLDGGWRIACYHNSPAS